MKFPDISFDDFEIQTTGVLEIGVSLSPRFLFSVLKIAMAKKTIARPTVFFPGQILTIERELQHNLLCD